MLENAVNPYPTDIHSNVDSIPPMILMIMQGVFVLLEGIFLTFMGESQMVVDNELVTIIHQKK